MHPILFTIGSLQVPSYTVLLDLGLILGLLLTYYEGRQQLKRGTLALDFGLWVVIGGILGGRIGYVLANLRLFSEDWTSAIRIWEGGLAFHGAFLGGLLVMIFFAALQPREGRPVSFWQLADTLVPGLALGITVGWAACLMGGCSYGIPGEGFGYAILPDIYGVEASRFATQIVGAGISLVLFLGVLLMRRRWPFAGASFLVYTLLYFAAQFFLEFTRGDEAIYVGPWRLAQVLNLVLALASAVGLVVLWWRWNAAGKPEESETVGDETEDASAEPDAAEDETEEAIPGEAAHEADAEGPVAPEMPEGQEEPAGTEEWESEPAGTEEWESEPEAVD